MAIGDAADAAGMETLAGTEDLRESYIEHNRTRDYLANHATSGQHPASNITGTFDAATKLTGIAPKAKVLDGGASGVIDPTTIPGQFTVSTHLGIVGAIAAGDKVTFPDAYSRSVSGLGGYRALYVAADGTVGYVPSSERFKQDITPAAIPRHVLREFRVVFYHYIEAVERIGFDAPLELGAIAEQAHDLGLTFLVDYDDAGRPHGLNERHIPYLALLLAQDAEDRIDELTRTVYDLIARVQELEGTPE